MEKITFLSHYWDWCCRFQDQEEAAGFETLSWVGGIEPGAFFEFSRLHPEVKKIDLLRAMAADRMRRVYSFEAAIDDPVRRVDIPAFSAFRARYVDSQFQNPVFSKAVALRTRNRRRDRKIAKSIQATLKQEGWTGFRATPSELGSTCLSEDVELRLWLVLPHGSLEYYCTLKVGSEPWMERESYLGWLGFGGSTEVWSTLEDASGLAEFVVGHARAFRTLVEEQLGRPSIG